MNLRSKKALEKGQPVTIEVDGREVEAMAGESVAAALVAMGKVAFRTDRRTGQARGIYCGIGQCHECLVTIDGRPNARACQNRVAAGMSVETDAEAVEGSGRD